MRLSPPVSILRQGAEALSWAELIQPGEWLTAREVAERVGRDVAVKEVGAALRAAMKLGVLCCRLRLTKERMEPVRQFARL